MADALDPTGASVTVVVPTHNRSAFLSDVITRLKAQTRTDFRVVIVDDGSTDDSREVADRAIAGDHRFCVRSTSNRGPAAARNVACTDATTPWLAFTDDDCLPEPEWLAELIAAAERDGAQVVQGCTISDPRVRRAELPWFARGKSVRAWSLRFQTCNLLVSTSALQSLGGFDERFSPRGFGEDTDLGFRLMRTGATTSFASRAVVHHRVIVMTYHEFLRRRYRWAQVVRMVAVNPDTRATFPHRYVAQRAHVAIWAGLPLTALGLSAGRWYLPLLAVAGYVVRRVVASRSEGRPLAVRVLRAPLELLGVAVEAVGFVVESVRHRTLLV